MPRPVVELVREMFSGPNLRPTVVLLTSAVCLSAWNAVGNYSFWIGQGSVPEDPVLAAIQATAATAILLGVIPALVVKFVLRERLSIYGVRLGNLRFSLLAILLASPLVIFIGYCSAQSPVFQAVYPINPVARDSATALAWHLFGQIFFYAAWEFHFRGFLQHGLERRAGVTTAICVQALASTLAHFGKPGSEVFGAIIGGLLWGALAWRTRSLFAGFCQHWLLGASLDFFIFRGISR
jgi:membrane protease YdiL (CAAX protease family)